MTPTTGAANAAGPPLLAVEIETFSACNRACSYCPNAEHRRPTTGYMEETLYRKVIADLSAMGFGGRLSFHFYNEPLLDRRLPAFVAHARRTLREEVYIKIFTNGDRLTPETFRRLTVAGVDKFWVTRHEGRPNRIDELLSMLSDSERSRVAVRGHQSLDLSNRGGLLPLVRRVDAPLPTSCALPSARMVIALNGNVVLCCEDYHERVILGNVAEQSVESIWLGEEFRRMRSELERGNRGGVSICRGCSNVSYTMAEHTQKLRELRSGASESANQPTAAAGAVR